MLSLSLLGRVIGQKVDEEGSPGAKEAKDPGTPKYLLHLPFANVSPFVALFCPALNFAISMRVSSLNLPIKRFPLESIILVALSPLRSRVVEGCAILALLKELH